MTWFNNRGVAFDCVRGYVSVIFVVLGVSLLWSF